MGGGLVDRPPPAKYAPGYQPLPDILVAVCNITTLSGLGNKSYDARPPGDLNLILRNLQTKTHIEQIRASIEGRQKYTIVVLNCKCNKKHVFNLPFGDMG